MFSKIYAFLFRMSNLATVYRAVLSYPAHKIRVLVLTWVATRIGYAHKQRLGIAEARVGRDEHQVLANLGLAALCSLLYAFGGHDPRLLVAMVAAFAEAAADTMSSEIGQAL